MTSQAPNQGGADTPTGGRVDATTGGLDEAAGGAHDDLCFTARALAQTHPLTASAHRYRQACFERERAKQPVPELADWAGAGLLVGYCLRRAEERAAGFSFVPAVSTAEVGAASSAEPPARVASITDALRLGDADSVTLLPGAEVVAALDRLIATEVDKRREHLREQLDDESWAELEGYIAWWVIHGYALRAGEAASPSHINDSTGDSVGDAAASGEVPRVLVVGVGNVLNGDDGLGVEVVRRLGERTLPHGVKLAETGIGGIHLVHELMAGFDALIVVDAVDRGRPPGTVMVIDPDVIDVSVLDVDERHDLLADMHLATPDRALMVARALGVLPERTKIVGCQPFSVDTLAVGLSPGIERAAEVAVDEVLRCLTEFQASDF